MTTSDAIVFMDRIESDADFATRLGEVSSDPAAVREILSAEGFELDPDAVREAFLERFGSQLSEEQLAAVAGGLSQEAHDGIVVGAGLAGIGIGFGVLAAAAAF